MGMDLKCSECGKGNRKVELGQLFYSIKSPSETMIIRESIICSKCKTDISNQKCLIKKQDFLWKVLAANVSLIGESENDFAAPKHLCGAIPIKDEDYEQEKSNCKAIPQLVERF